MNLQWGKNGKEGFRERKKQDRWRTRVLEKQEGKRKERRTWMCSGVHLTSWCHSADVTRLVCDHGVFLLSVDILGLCFVTEMNELLHRHQELLSNFSGCRIWSSAGLGYFIVPVERFGLQKVIRLFVLASFINCYILHIQTCKSVVVEQKMFLKWMI